MAAAVSESSGNFTTLFVLIPAEIPCSLIERLYICNGGIRLDMVSGREDKTSARCAVCYQVFDFTSHIIGSSERHYVLDIERTIHREIFTEALLERTAQTSR